MFNCNITREKHLRVLDRNLKKLKYLKLLELFDCQILQKLTVQVSLEIRGRYVPSLTIFD